MNNRYILAAMAGVAAVVILAYGPSLNNKFVNWDDDAHLLENPFVHPINVRDIFTTTVNGIYIPLTSLSFALEYHFFRADPFVYHLDNLLLHLAVTMMAFLFCLRCGLSVPAAGMAALIFGLHPTHVESVAWVTERKDVLYAFFYMLAILRYLDHLRTLKESSTYRAGWAFGLTLFFGFLSIMAKPSALSLPGILFLLDWFFRRKLTIRSCVEKIYCGLAVFPVAWVTYALLMHTQVIKFPGSVLTGIWCFVFYIQKMFYPDYFVLIYHSPAPVALSNPVYAVSVLLFIVLLASLWYFRKNRLFVFANLFYIFSIFFLLRADYNVGLNVVGDRFLYLPMLGWCMLLGNSSVNLWDRFRNVPFARTGLLLAGATVLSFLFFQTARQSRVWYNGASLWEHQLRHQSQAATALIYNKLAQAYMQDSGFENNSGKIRMAEDYLHKAIAIKPDYAQAYFHLGQLAECRGDVSLARIYFNRTIELDGGHVDAYFQLGLLHDREGQYAQATKAFNKAIAISPDHEGMYLQILDFYDKAIAADPQAYQHERDALTEKYFNRFGKYP
ncbi:MAG: tetratricopeptide repeat protein [Candidatus Omnitrophica bacterium]|nr:tetratricopeptide repeat protein [Candidatus Omnitrophota bacterium]